MDIKLNGQLNDLMDLSHISDEDLEQEIKKRKEARQKKYDDSVQLKKDEEYLNRRNRCDILGLAYMPDQKISNYSLIKLSIKGNSGTDYSPYQKISSTVETYYHNTFSYALKNDKIQKKLNKIVDDIFEESKKDPNVVLELIGLNMRKDLLKNPKVMKSYYDSLVERLKQLDKKKLKAYVKENNYKYKNDSILSKAIREVLKVNEPSVSKDS